MDWQGCKKLGEITICDRHLYVADHWIDLLAQIGNRITEAGCLDENAGLLCVVDTRATEGHVPGQAPPAFEEQSRELIEDFFFRGVYP